MDISNVYRQSPTPDETPALIKQKLAQFAKALDEIDIEKMKGYLAAKEKCPAECGDAFKLVFLRCEVFNVKLSVERWTKYWDARIKLFGEKRAFLPMDDLDCASEDDKTALQMGYLQVADETDADGRAILLMDFRKEGCDIPSDSLLRVVWHQIHIALRQESAQKQGVVVYVRTVDKLTDWRLSLAKKISQAGRGILPMRLAGFHYINPPAIFSAIIKVGKVLVGKKLRHRFYAHWGSTDEVLESLSRFGLGTKERLPAMFGGNLMFH